MTRDVYAVRSTVDAQALAQPSTRQVVLDEPTSVKSGNPATYCTAYHENTGLCSLHANSGNLPNACSVWKDVAWVKCSVKYSVGLECSVIAALDGVRHCSVFSSDSDNPRECSVISGPTGSGPDNFCSVDHGKKYHQCSTFNSAPAHCSIQSGAGKRGVCSVRASAEGTGECSVFSTGGTCSVKAGASTAGSKCTSDIAGQCSVHSGTSGGVIGPSCSVIGGTNPDSGTWCYGG